jgi:hypothetical protein
MTGAITGQFVVGDGTLVGQGATTVGTANKPKLVLKGGAFINNIISGDFQVAQFGVGPKLILKGKQASVYDTSVASAPGTPKLILKGQFVIPIVPIFAFAGKSSLVLKGKAVSVNVSSTPIVGKPKLILNGKLYHAGVVALTPTIPLDVALVPTAPEPDGPLVVGTLVLVPSVPQTIDLVPTEEEFR